MNRLKELFIKYKEIILYLIVGVMTTAVSWLSYALLRLILDVSNPILMQVAVVARWIAAVIFAYVMNRVFVFESKNKNILLEAVKFTSARITTLLIEMFVMWLLATVLKLNDWIATFACAVIVTILNYIFSKLIVFNKNKSDKNELLDKGSGELE